MGRIVLVPSLGILLFNTITKYCDIIKSPFSSPLWGFFYLIEVSLTEKMRIDVLVPSLGILLFNSYSCILSRFGEKGSRPLSGDSFI